ncbi:hypothetical protein IAD21_04495 [Abditibacteriota bacterium]|nr:hypothetical protein IAD21_04495 [Abditibacteriota bacterium]
MASTTGATRPLRIFISSPGDVGQERFICTRVIGRLSGEFAGRVELQPILWEHEPLRATSHFQEQILPPSQTDIAICILWSRLGTRLPDQFQRDDGSSYASGTEWEFEDAARAFQEHGSPDLMVYRKVSEALTPLSDERALLDRLAQKKALEGFIDRWFGNPQSTFKAAFHPFTSPDQFEELLESHLCQLIENRLPRHVTSGENPGVVSWHRGSPFRGLATFEAEHAPIFFGRTRAIGEIRDVLVRRASEGCAFTLIFGRSGSGKSSLMRAGVLPTITEPGVVERIGLWRSGIFRPADAMTAGAETESPDLVHSLSRCLLEKNTLPELRRSGLDVVELAALLRESPERAIAPIRAALERAAEELARKEGLEKPPTARLILAIDQLEELWTLEGVDAALRRRFVEALSALARSGIVWIVATMRSDFYARCAEIPQLAALKEGAGSYDLQSPSFAEVGQMISQPARAAGLRFETDPKTGEQMDDRLHEAAWRDPEALPLLEFTLEELWQLRTPEGVLTFAAYERLGGPEGALARRAEEVFSELDPTIQAALPSVLRFLVTVGSDSAQGVAGRRVVWDILCADSARRALVEAFVAARLLVTDRTDDGKAVVGVAHEALLRRWPRVQQWLLEDREFLNIRERVVTSASRWQTEQHHSDLLLPSGKLLVEASDLLTQRREDLDSTLIDYIETSVKKQRRTTQTRVLSIASITSLFFAVVLGFGLFSFRQWQLAEKQKGLALQAIQIWTNEIPVRLQDVPGTLPVLQLISRTNLDIVDKILKLNPDTPQAQREKALNFERSGYMLVLLGRYEDALSSYQQGAQIFQSLNRRDSTTQARTDLASNYERIGDVYLEMDEATRALSAYNNSLQLLQSHSDKESESAQSRRVLSVSFEKVGDAQYRVGHLDEAHKAYARSLDLRQTLAPKGSFNPQAQRDLAVSYEKIGRMAMNNNDLKEAKPSFERSLAIRVALSHANPTPEAQRDVAIAYKDWGDLQLLQAQSDEALSAYTKSLNILTNLSPFSSQARRDLSVIYNKMGDIRSALGDHLQAATAYSKAITLVAALVRAAPTAKDRALNTKYLAELYATLAWSNLLGKRPQDAVIAAGRALKADPSQTWIKANLAHGYCFVGQWEKAEVIYLENRRQPISGNQTFADVVRADFATFRQRKLVTPTLDKEMQRIERLLAQNTL